jgi:hypothetical protein
MSALRSLGSLAGPRAETETLSLDSLHTGLIFPTLLPAVLIGAIAIKPHIPDLTKLTLPPTVDPSRLANAKFIPGWIRISIRGDPSFRRRD